MNNMTHPQIYVSSACSSRRTIIAAVEELVHFGFRNIELTGGTIFYRDYEGDLLRLQEKYGLNYLVHNYFPPSQQEFVLNLASVDSELGQKTFQHLKRGLELTSTLGADRFGFHAGFFVDPSISELGGALGPRSINSPELSLATFCERFSKLSQEAGDIELYLENNVYAHSTYKTYGKTVPFMLLSFNDYLNLRSMIDFKLLLDLGHLKVTIRSLGLDFREEATNMVNASDYIHISDNDGLHDQNHAIRKGGGLYQCLQESDMARKLFTLEIYDGMDEVSESHGLILSLIESQ